MANNFSAVDGRNSGAQIQVISKGGTNQFHGSGSFYYQDQNFASKNVFETGVPDFSKKQFGTSLGGPIMKNRLFFFTSYEGLRQAGGRGSSFTVETPQYRDFVLRRARTASPPTSSRTISRVPTRRRTSATPAAPRRDPAPSGRQTASWTSDPRSSSPTSGVTATSSTSAAIGNCGPARTGCTPTSTGPVPDHDRQHPAILRLSREGDRRIRQSEPYPHLQQDEAQRVPRRHDAADRPAPGPPRHTRHSRHHDYRHLGLRGDPATRAGGTRQTGISRTSSRPSRAATP